MCIRDRDTQLLHERETGLQSFDESTGGRARGIAGAANPLALATSTGIFGPGPAETVDYLDYTVIQEPTINCPCYQCLATSTNRGTDHGISYNDIDMCELEGDIANDGRAPRHKRYVKREYGWDDKCIACERDGIDPPHPNCKNNNGKPCYLIPFGVGGCDCIRDWDPENMRAEYITAIENRITEKENRVQSTYCEGRQEVKGGEGPLGLNNLNWGDSDDPNAETPGCEGIESEDVCNNSYESVDGSYCEWKDSLTGWTSGSCEASDKNFCNL